MPHALNLNNQEKESPLLRDQAWDVVLSFLVVIPTTLCWLWNLFIETPSGQSLFNGRCSVELSAFTVHLGPLLLVVLSFGTLRLCLCFLFLSKVIEVRSVGSDLWKCFYSLQRLPDMFY